MSDASGNSLLLILTNPADGMEEEYNDWYSNIHIQEVSAIDGFVSAQRFKLCSTQLHADQSYRYLAIYEIEKGKEAQALQNLQNAAPNLNMRPVLDLDNLDSMLVEPISGVARGLSTLKK